VAQSFKLVYTPEALESISKLSSDLKRIAERVLVQVSGRPEIGKRLTGKFKGIYSERVTRRYRILYLVKHSQKEVVILDLKHRKEAYE
jgi:mRNA-degrading endonuclease RelE of RelBE toxin-antitoxin system